MISLYLQLAVLTCVGVGVVADSLLVDPVSKDNSAQCQCYLVSGPDEGYFQYHRFWDFRNIPNDGSNDYTVAPPLIDDSENSGDEPITSSYFNTSNFVADWAIQTGSQSRGGPIQNYDSAQNIYISRNTSAVPTYTYLTIRTNRLESFMSTMEMDSNQQNVFYSSIRVRARVIPNGLGNFSAPSSGNTALDDSDAGSNSSHPVDAGAVWGFFTYHNDEQESDIEILTQDDTTQIHYSNQPDYDAATDTTVPDASTQVTFPDDLVWTEWIDHRIDWFDGISRWYINDELVLNKTKNVPTVPSELIINLWSDGGNWSGNMTVGGQVTVGIEWIDMYFNISGSSSTNACQVGCNADDIQNVGYPEVAFNQCTQMWCDSAISANNADDVSMSDMSDADADTDTDSDTDTENTNADGFTTDGATSYEPASTEFAYDEMTSTAVGSAEVTPTGVDADEEAFDGTSTTMSTGAMSTGGATTNALNTNEDSPDGVSVGSVNTDVANDDGSDTDTDTNTFVGWEEQ